MPSLAPAAADATIGSNCATVAACCRHWHAECCLANGLGLAFVIGPCCRRPRPSGPRRLLKLDRHAPQERIGATHMIAMSWPRRHLPHHRGRRLFDWQDGVVVRRARPHPDRLRVACARRLALRAIGFVHGMRVLNLGEEPTHPRVAGPAPEKESADRSQATREPAAPSEPLRLRAAHRGCGRLAVAEEYIVGSRRSILLRQARSSRFSP